MNIDPNLIPKGTKKCSTCEEEKPMHMFNVSRTDILDKRGKYYMRGECKDKCELERKNEERRIRKRQKIVTMKGESACAVCDYSKERDGDYFTPRNISYFNLHGDKTKSAIEDWDYSDELIKEKIHNATPLCKLCYGNISEMENQRNNKLSLKQIVEKVRQQYLDSVKNK